MSADPDVMRYIGDGRVLDQGQSWREIAMHVSTLEGQDVVIFGIDRPLV